MACFARIMAQKGAFRYGLDNCMLAVALFWGILGHLLVIMLGFSLK